MKKLRWLALGAAVAAAVVGLTLAFTGGGGSTQLSHADFVRLWRETRVGQPTAEVLARWPTTPYQHYTDGVKNDCYEFADVPNKRFNNLPQNLYNLCFRDGVLRSKTLG